MNEAQSAAQIASANWRRSSHSAANNECVEVAHVQSWALLRDSKDRDRTGLTTSAAAFTTFVNSVKAAD